MEPQRSGGLDEGDVDPDALVQFRRWYDEARAAGVVQADAMTLATVALDGRPAARTVLLKAVDERGFVFFTNYESRKGMHLAVNPACALAFLWRPLDRQVTVVGRAERLPVAASEVYFASRPRDSRLGAWASRQSRVIDGREALERRLAELEDVYAGTDDIPLPPWWGGFLVVPETVELWHGRPGRLHDRLRYVALPDGGWRLERLSP